MILSYLFIGIIATVIGALPPGASNLAVVKTSVQENIQQSLKIGYGAGIGEVFLAFIAMSFGMVVTDFFTMHLWIQIVLFVIVGLAGFHFLKTGTSKKKKPVFATSKYITGFLLSIINPPVLIYWVVVFSLLHSKLMLHPSDSILGFSLFFIGVFLGKVMTLYGYGKLGAYMRYKKGESLFNLNKIIGVALMSISGIQLVKIVLF